jgi:hypothetical protein
MEYKYHSLTTTDLKDFRNTNVHTLTAEVKKKDAAESIIPNVLNLI